MGQQLVCYSDSVDPYATLGVAPDASSDEIKQAFRRLAREHHPDRNPGDPQAEKRFQEINAAYQLLGDPQRRAAFEQQRRTPGGFTDVSFEDLFGDLFRGATSGRSASAQGPVRDVARPVELTFEEAALGCSKTVEYERLDHCESCGGDGAEPGSRSTTCTACGGSGVVSVRAAPFFSMSAERECPRCDGRGVHVDQPCRHCSGRGVSRRRRRVEVSVPPGIEHGARQTIAGAGNRRRRGEPPGDLELTVLVGAHPDFSREGDDVLSEVEVPFTRAALGGAVEVRTLHGAAQLEIPPGTQAGSTLKLRDQGVPHRFRRGRGDHRFRVKVTLPRQTSPRARELIGEFELAQQEPEDGVLSRLKSWLS